MVWVVLGLLLLGGGCAGGAEQKVAAEQQAPQSAVKPAKPAAQAEPAAQATPSSTATRQLPVPAGKFVYGTTEEQFQAFLAHSIVNFPGMTEKLRRTFIIPSREISLPQFKIDEFEVTNEQYRDFVITTGYQPANPANYLKNWTTRTSYPDWAATFPVVWISQEDAAAYCKWRGGRLPTEEEWEKAARGTDGRAFPWGNSFPAPETSNLGSTGKAEPAGNRPEDKSPPGAYDLGGNVAEITASITKPQGLIVIRGGSFKSGVRDAMTYKRTLLAPQLVRSESIGCRCAGQ